MLIIGSHVSFGSKQLLQSVTEAVSYNADTFMFYTGAPQNTIRKDIDDTLTLQATAIMQENKIDISAQSKPNGEERLEIYDGTGMLFIPFNDVNITINKSYLY